MTASQLISTLPTINGAAPHAHVTAQGIVMIDGEHGDGLIDFYGEFRGNYPYIHPDLEAWAAKHDGHFEWENPGSIAFWKD